jgi:hypothetical protein
VNARGKWAGQQYGNNIKLGPVVSTNTIGWRSTCTCENEGKGRCIVLDPFMGSGTTAVVAANLGRDYIGIDANPDYVSMTEKRVREEASNLVLPL